MKAPRIHTNCLLLLFALGMGMLLLGPTGTAAQTFDSAQLKKMVRLLQALRKKVDSRLQAVGTRGSSLPPTVNSAQAALNEAVVNLTMASVPYWSSLVEISSSIGERRTAAVKAKQMKLDSTYSYMGNVTLSRSMTYSMTEAKATVAYGGVYLYHVNLRTGPQDQTFFTIVTRDYRGVTKNSYSFYMDWEVAPVFVYFNLEAGDSVTINPLLTSKLRSETEGTHVSLHYLGNSAPPPAVPTTQAPSPLPPGTTGIWLG